MSQDAKHRDLTDEKLRSVAKPELTPAERRSQAISFAMSGRPDEEEATRKRIEDLYDKQFGNPSATS